MVASGREGGLDRSAFLARPRWSGTPPSGAIHGAIRQAREGDIVVIAGKGHEQGQEIGDEKLPFDDREVAREALRG